MNLRKLLLLILFFVPLLGFSQKIKVACIGNSITYGAGIVNPEKNSYPAQLQSTLGDGYEVVNFGISGTTLLKKGDYPYVNYAHYENSKLFKPDIVLIKLGTNDAKTHNRGFLKEDYYNDYLELIRSYQALESKPRIILLKPVLCYLNENVWQSVDSVYTSCILPVIEKLAYDEHLEIIDLYHVFPDSFQKHLMPDQLHPSSIGAGMMAQRIAHVIENKTCSFDIFPQFEDQVTGEFNFYGFNGYDLKRNKVVVPKRVAMGQPWIWRARFWGHQPQADIALLELGFHLVYCDVADLYGSKEAVNLWNDFYDQMVTAGLNKKVVLEGMSRGGLIVYNWAAVNSEKVAVIYADAPVLDFKSWPLGKGLGKGSYADTEQLLKAYRFKNEQQALNYQNNPIDKSDCYLSIPILHVVGDADSIVPVAENTALFEAKLKAQGGVIKVIHKPSVGHHPHSLFNPKEIVDFILQYTDCYVKPSTNADQK